MKHKYMLEINRDSLKYEISNLRILVNFTFGKKMSFGRFKVF